MSAYFFQRVLSLLLTLWGTSVLVFVLLDWLPGNAAQVMMGADASPQAVQALVELWGLDKPAYERYGQWMAGLLRGDWGMSLAYGEPVWGLIAERLALTLPLALLAMTLTCALAIPAGVYAASRHARWGDLSIMGMTQLGLAVPNFWFAILLILLFAVQLQWLPAGGFPGWHEGWGVAVESLLLPALSLAAVQTAVLTRMVRSAMLEVLHEDFIRTARAKGLSLRATLWRHALRNAMLPVLTLMGLQFANLLAGAIVIENVFYLPGLGRLIFQSIANRDMAVIRGCVLLLAAGVVCLNYAVDMLSVWLDPRLKLKHLSPA